MSINDIGQKIKPLFYDKAKSAVSKIRSAIDIKEDLFIVISIILIGLAGFGLGKLSALEKGRGGVEILPASVSDFNGEATLMTSVSNQSALVSSSTKGLLVASKTGKKYHFPWCAGALQITDKNKIWFDSYEAAQMAGYTAASNCKGLK